MSVNIDDLTLGQIKQLVALVGNQPAAPNQLQENTLLGMVGSKAIVRTYSAGVWFGQIEDKAGNEVILKNARRMWRWQAAESISLSACAKYGVNHSNSKIVEAVDSVWLEAIEIIPCSNVAIKSLEDAPNVKAQ